MADLFLDIRDRYIRAIVSDNGEVRFKGEYPLQSNGNTTGSHNDQPGDQQPVSADELGSVVSTIRLDSGIALDHAHLIIPPSNVQVSTQRLPRMPQQDALTLLTRKTAERTSDETPQISIIPMSIDQNHQEWLTEYIPSTILRAYRSDFASARLKLKTVTTVLDSVLHAVSPIRESIFNAHAIFEINSTCVVAYYISSSSLLLHETLSLAHDEEYNNPRDTDRAEKKHMFAILDLVYRVNAQFQSAHPMTPLQKVWLCGTEKSITELSVTLQDAMDVETALLAGGEENAFAALLGFVQAHKNGDVTNFLHPEILRRFPLRKKKGLLIYIATALLTAFIIVSTEFRHSRLSKQAAIEKRNLAALKSSQAASASFAKNLDFLRKLSGSQTVFYPILRELAMNLPDTVYLDSFIFSGKDNQESIDISVSFSQTSDLGTQKTLTRLMEVMNHSPYLKHYREPSVTSISKEQRKTMTVKFTCEVHPLDTSK